MDHFMSIFFATVFLHSRARRTINARKYSAGSLAHCRINRVHDKCDYLSAVFELEMKTQRFLTLLQIQLIFYSTKHVFYIRTVILPCDITNYYQDAKKNPLFGGVGGLRKCLYNNLNRLCQKPPPLREIYTRIFFST